METVCTSSRRGPTEKQSQEYLYQVMATGDTILQTFRRDEDQLVHVMDTIPNGKFNKIADVGCGTGEYLWHVVSLNPEAEAIGYNLYNCQAQVGKAAGLDIRVLDILNEEIEEKNFNLVLCNYTLGYFSPEERIRVIRKLHNMLYPGGRLSIYDIAPRTMLSAEIFDYSLVTPREMFRDIRSVFGEKARIRHTLFADFQATLAKNIKQVASEQQLDMFKRYARPVHYIVSKPTEKELHGYG